MVNLLLILVYTRLAVGMLLKIQVNTGILSAPVEVFNKLSFCSGTEIGILCQLQVTLGKLCNSRDNEEIDGACRAL